MDTVMLKSILTPDVDQLVSSGEWRTGIEGAMKGMVRSSTSNPGKRTLVVYKGNMWKITAIGNMLPAGN